MTVEVGVSTNNLVEPSSKENYGEGKKLPQYIAALSVCMGSVAAGTVLGWTGNITESQMMNGTLNDIHVSKDDYGWTGSFMTLGALVMCIPIGFICDLIGRKLAMLLTIIPFTVGWLLIILADNVGMIFAGRFITGLAGGAFCVAAPMYTSEIAQKEVRGALGSYFQLLLTVGIFFVYILGAFIDSARTVSIVCICVPIVFGIIFFLQPETPFYSLKKNNEEAARKALRRLRGDNYNIDAELADIKQQIENERNQKISFIESFRKRATKKSLLICFGLMFFQQLGGINAVIFYVGTIFEASGSSLKTSDATLIVGAMQVVATFVSSLIIDKFGRKILLLISDVMMAVSGILLAVYFTLKDRHIISEDEATNIGSLPIIALCLFIVVFSLGFGPIPWMISAELLPSEIKSNASSAAALFNWFLAFIVTKFYNDLVKAINTDTTFYIFSGISLVGTAFVFFLVPETKGKTLEEIQDILNGTKPTKKGIDNEAFNS